MKLVNATNHDLPVLRIEGDVEFDDAPKLEQAAWDALGRTGVTIVLDLEKCTYLNSAGLAVLFSLVRWARPKKGRILAVRPSAELLHLFRSVRLTGERGFYTFVDMESAYEELLATG
ncbi:MAG: STAS domain-containing protein [Actinobacteria bacterium]|nr:STAS domain-containing protein [Actinomycetota bacterium]